MNLQSIGYRSDLIFTEFDGEVIDRGNYLVVHTRSNPNYFWGNLLIYPEPPAPGDFSNWCATFKREFTNPKIYHQTFAWDSDKKEMPCIQDFLSAGFIFEKRAVLLAHVTDIKIPPKFAEELMIKEISGTGEWEQMIALQLAAAHGDLPKSEWEKFYRKQAELYQRMDGAGQGKWFGGYVDNHLVCGLGIFHKLGLGRYQVVCTHPNFQRRGFAGTLVYQSAKYAFARMGIEQLVMCADPDYHAIKIYENVGFIRSLEESGVYWWDKSRQS